MFDNIEDMTGFEPVSTATGFGGSFEKTVTSPFPTFGHFFKVYF